MSRLNNEESSVKAQVWYKGAMFTMHLWQEGHICIDLVSPALSSVCHHILRSSPIIVKNLHMQGLITRRNQEEESTYAECDGADHTRTITLITHISQRPGASSGQIMPRPSRVISVVFLSTYHAFRSISILSLSLSHPPKPLIMSPTWAVFVWHSKLYPSPVCFQRWQFYLRWCHCRHQWLKVNVDGHTGS